MTVLVDALVDTLIAISVVVLLAGAVAVVRRALFGEQSAFPDWPEDSA